MSLDVPLEVQLTFGNHPRQLPFRASLLKLPLVGPSIKTRRMGQPSVTSHLKRFHSLFISLFTVQAAHLYIPTDQMSALNNRNFVSCFLHDLTKYYSMLVDCFSPKRSVPQSDYFEVTFHGDHEFGSHYLRMETVAL